MSNFFWNVYWVHFASCFLMIGSIWFVQLVHYSLLSLVDKNFRELERRHIFYASFLAFPIMAVEGITGLLLLLQRELIHWMQVNFLLLILIWGVTFWFCLPKHFHLLKQHDNKKIRSLKRANLFRAIFWTLRGALLLTVVYLYF